MEKTTSKNLNHSKRKETHHDSSQLYRKQLISQQQII